MSRKRLRCNHKGICFGKLPFEIGIMIILLVNVIGSNRFTDHIEGTAPVYDMTDGSIETLEQNSDKVSAETSPSIPPIDIRAAESTDNDCANRGAIIAQAKHLALGYDYDNALKLIEKYRGKEGDYRQYKELTESYDSLKKEKQNLVLYGGEYTSITQINHIFFHSLIADNTKAFDGDQRSKGYNKYMVTVSEFNKILTAMYQEGYVLVRMSDLVKKKALEDGTSRYVENPIYLREGKKPFVLSQDDVNYYSYMDGDGFATRIVIGADNKPTCSMLQEDGTYKNGPFDVIPLLDAFVEKHPDFSYRGAKGLIALTGYEGVLGYRTNDKSSPTYRQDKKTVRGIAKLLKAEGWEFASHSWGHKDMYAVSYDLLKRDTDKWQREVETLIGPTDVYVFPFGNDIERTVATYSSNKYLYLKKKDFRIFVGVYKEPWMQIKKDYIRMERRPIDGQALLEFPERLKDLFRVKHILDPGRPPMDW